jgi:Zn-dependent protease/predicted transcriptional regulator
MFGRRVTLFKLLGFEVRVDASWLVLAVLISWTLAVAYFPSQFKGLPRGDYWWMGIASAVGLFISIVVHEFSHSLVARRHGLPMKGITLFIFGGVAEMGDEPSDAKTEFRMAIAGPIASIVLGAVLYVVYLAVKGVLPVTVTGIIGYLAWINWALAAFNMVPAFPLDGGRVLRSALWSRRGDLRGATRTASTLGRVFGLVLILFAVWEWLSGDFVGAMWYFLIGLFLRGAAQSSYQQVMIRLALQGEAVSRFMNPHPVTVPSHIPVEELVNEYIYRYHYKMFPVLDSSERLVGCVSTGQVKTIPREEWNRHSVQEIMAPRSGENTVAPDADAISALSKMNASGRSRLMVAEGDRLVGVIALKDLLALLSAKVDLEGDAFRSSRPPANKWPTDVFHKVP